MTPFWSYALAAIGITSLWLAATRPRSGWWLNIAAQAVWLAYAITTRQWGFLLTAAAYAIVYTRLLRQAYQQTPTPPRPRHCQYCGEPLSRLGRLLRRACPACGYRTPTVAPHRAKPAGEARHV